MNLNQIAILLELIGFILASLFIAVLKIERVRVIADKLKQKIVSMSEPPDKDAIKSRIETVGLLFLFGFIVLESPKLATALRQKKQITLRKYIQLLAAWIFIECPLLVFFLILFRLAEAIDKMLVFLSVKMTGHEAVTNAMIILGSLLIFIGLVIEFIVTFRQP